MAMARSSLGTSMAMVRRLCTAVRELPGKGRGVIATAAIAPNTQLLQVAPAAQVLKKTVAASNTPHCAACMRPTAWGVCGEACEDEFVARGYDLLERVDLSPLHRLHEMEGRKFPLLIAQLLAALLADVKRTRTLPESWPPLELCFTELHEEAEVQVETEHTQLLRAFADAGLANEPTLALFMPLARYRRLLGAAQLNAFELSLSHGAKVSALLPGLASCFNHSCEPNVLISCGETSTVCFVAGEGGVAAGAELCISYIDVEASGHERRELLQHKYGFMCECEKCCRGE